MAVGNIPNFLPAIIHYQSPLVLLFYPWCGDSRAEQLMLTRAR